MMHKSPLLFRLTADCTLELPPTRTISLTQCCFRDDPNRDLSKDFCRFHHLEPAEIDILSETPIWYPKPIILTQANQSFPSKFVRHEERPVKPIFLKHLLANFKDYLNKIQETFMSVEESNRSTRSSRSSYPERSRSRTAASPAPSHSVRQSTTSASQRGSSVNRDSWQNMIAGLPCLSPAKITGFIKSVWHGFEVMGLTEDNTVG